MMEEITSTNPVVKAIITGNAPAQARLAAARGILPIPPLDLLEILVNLVKSETGELAAAARETLKSQDYTIINPLLESKETSPQILSFFTENSDISYETHRAVIAHQNTPDEAIVNFIKTSGSDGLIDIIARNEQRLVRCPDLIEAILANPLSSREAKRKAEETKREFFEKTRGAEQIAAELRSRGQQEAADFFKFAESIISNEDVDFISQYIEVSDVEIDDSWLALEHIEEFYEETDQEREAIIHKILGELGADEDEEISKGEWISLVNKIYKMTIKDRIRLAMKGNREARMILIRDPKRLVAKAVINNPQITEQEIEKIALMRTIPDDILREIGNRRRWARNYAIVHNLVKNPRTPITQAMAILSRMQSRDLNALSKNRNVSDAVRKQAFRLFHARNSGR